MKKNIHPVERAVRIVGGAGLASLAFWGPSSYWFLLGLIPLATGLLGWCPPYALLGISTCPKEAPGAQGITAWKSCSRGGCAGGTAKVFGTS